jgi:hypothetical protein
MKNDNQITQQQLDDLAKQNRKSIARRDLQDIERYIGLIKEKLIQSKWTEGWTDETIINASLAFVVDHMNEFNKQFK